MKNRTYFKNIPSWVVGIVKVLLRMSEAIAVGTQASVLTDVSTSTITSNTYLKGVAGLAFSALRYGLQAFVDYSDSEPPTPSA